MVPDVPVVRLDCPTTMVACCPFENAKTLLAGISNNVKENIAIIFFVSIPTPTPLCLSTLVYKSMFFQFSQGYHDDVQNDSVQLLQDNQRFFLIFGVFYLLF